MTILVALPTFAVFIAIWIHYIRHNDIKEWFINPIFYFIFNATLQGPFRSLIIGTGFVEGMDVGFAARTESLYLITTLAFIAYSSSYFFQRRFSQKNNNPLLNKTPLFFDPSTQMRVWFILLLGTLTATIGYLYKLKFGTFQTLHTYGTPPSLLEVIATFFIDVRWFVYGACIILWAINHQRWTLPFLFLIAISCLVEALLSGSRGIILSLAWAGLAFVLSTGLRMRTLTLGGVLFAILLVLSFFLSIVRDSNLYFRGDIAADIEHVLPAIQDNFVHDIDDTSRGLANRVSYHQDALAMLIEARRTGKEDPREILALGSLADLALIIPRFLWPEKSVTVFERHMGYRLFGHPNLRYPVGPAGEAFFMLDWFGVVIGLYYGFIAAFAYEKLFRGTINPIAKIIFFFLLFQVFIRGNSALMNYVDVTIKSLIIFSPVLLCAHFFIPRRKKPIPKHLIEHLHQIPAHQPPTIR